MTHGFGGQGAGLSTLTSFYRPDRDALYTAPMFVAMVDENAIVRINDEHTDYEWVDIRDAESKLMWPADRAALKELRSEILSNGPAQEWMRIPLAETL